MQPQTSRAVSRVRRYGCPWLLTALLLASIAQAGERAPPDPSLRGDIAAALVRPDGARFVPYRWAREPEIVALYFGADWCAPCHAFVPTLREIRDTLRAAGADTEVVYVSLDNAESDMRRYMRRQAMPWPAIEHRRLRALPAIRALGGVAPPNLVLVDRQGRVLASAWQGRRRTGLQDVLQVWREHVAPTPVHPDVPLPSSTGAGKDRGAEGVDVVP
ncbi:alkyl hydroperoxide reductase [Luteimonas fraxinea]|uniref:Alkyl hydroperoxide reductase n=1 Tax=Luteimonas fraxinea TaxID=2901869 RepID=A0ABS8UEF9_9GAMM|nr:thioredoxin-like domain-containing protein [Luteimonas fraxinea]MCD9097280.1 alkyl hydroperoxide reductase [Luteimonas fraxinea]MCD9125155.1 alkyl hydroperoxide reductase [Luteimonas fraxinea]UHH11543.1 alkyl hydroperoxide reductase [Luteimonas fraxinea]